MERKTAGPRRSANILLAVVSGVVGVGLIAASLGAGTEASGAGSALLPGLLLLVICAANVAIALGLIGGPRRIEIPRSTPETLQADVERLLRAGRKLEAVEVYRRVTGVGLAEAKEAVERIGAEERADNGSA